MGLIKSFENPDKARLYADVQTVTGGFREEKTGEPHHRQSLAPVRTSSWPTTRPSPPCRCSGYPHSLIYPRIAFGNTFSHFAIEPSRNVLKTAANCSL